MAAPLNADVKNTILRSTEQLMQKNSFAEISLAAIAQQAGISKGTLYYHYKNKDEILFDITDRYLESLADNLQKWTADASKDTSFKRLARYTLREGVYDKSGNLRLYLYAAAVSGDDAVRQKVLAKYRQFSEMLAQRIAQRQPGRDANFTAWMLLTLMDGMLVQSRLKNPDFAVDAFIEQVVLLLDVLA